MSKKNFLIIIGFIVAAIVLAGGLFIYRQLLPKPKINSIIPSPIKESEVFDSQYAVITGQIINLDDNMITVRNSKGVNGSFALSPSLIIYPLLQNGFVSSSPTSDLQKIPINQDVSLSLRVENGRFLVENIAALGQPETPASSSAKIIIASPPVYIPPKTANESNK
jgi:hypothetical protein